MCENCFKRFWAFKGRNWHALKRVKGKWTSEGIVIAYSFTSKTEQVEKVESFEMIKSNNI
jgi:hypothetical protein